MNRKIQILLTVLFLICVIFTGNSRAQNTNRYIVTIEGPSGPVEDSVIRSGGAVKHVFGIIPAIAIQVPEQALSGLLHNPRIVSIEPDITIEALGKPASPPGLDKKPDESSQEIPWGVDRIDAEYAWELGYTGEGVKVAVLDTGIDYRHPDLKANCKGGINIINPLKKYTDDNGHGTHVAGIIAAVDNDFGVVGVAPKASLYAVKVLDRTGSGWLSDVIAGLEWSVDNQMDIVNMSLGSSYYSEAFELACEAAAQELIMVAAAGNEGGTVNYPAAFDTVIAVAATNSSDLRPSWSNYGPEIDIAAPGVNINSTLPGGLYSGETWSGTSMASPHVAGTIALNLSADIFGTADDLSPAGVDIYTGYGLVDAEEAATGNDNGDDLP